jgi:ATP/maltotriose-dependent transcriptional regulator MalT
LSAIERTVLALLPTPLSVAEIAAHLRISDTAAREHIRSVYRALRVSSRRTAVWEAQDCGLLP